ncbi:MAG TPA: SET domain-containing protein, partial [archaeon]|nr:SET domain-containing protein [archaeon]
MIVDIEVRESRIQGTGLFAKRSFRKDEFLFQTRPGRLISLREAKRMPRKAWDHLDDLENGQVEVTTAPTRYINHSCAPNVAWR